MRLNRNITAPFFAKFGRAMTLETPGGSTPFKAFLQPLRYKNKMYLGGTLTEIGYDTLRKFVLICPVSVNIPAVDGTRTRLEADGDTFCVDHCEKVFFGETPLYYWAVVHQNNDWRVQA
ncbi:MAG: hypothetical protein II621_06265 [Clostridia bacterium]|nr:hypothetical protein [Clostridia bacterium]MBQ4364872.1 hypothetical protein [Clostridia bacterium]MBQ6092405.1 hypothetical protein [Clostridia bacterium]MBR3095600.1 hypothetical protein [Clostridia bacterium]